MTARSSTASVAAIVALALASWPSPAHAQADAAAAEAVFDEAKALMTQGRYPEACEKFAESNRLDPGVGVLLYLGDCYEKAGKTASAWAAFREAIAAAHAAGQATREKTARERAAALEVQVGKLVIAVPPASDTPGLEIRRDGVAIGRALWGSAIPVDPGEHVVEVRAPGKKSWSSSIKIEAALAMLAIPPLESESIAPPVIVTPPHVDAPVVMEPSPAPPTTQRTLAFVFGGVGLAGISAGAVAGAITVSSWNTVKSDPSCHPFGNGWICGAGHQASKDAADRASSAATVADIGLIGGGVLLAAGVGLWIWSPRSSTRTVGRAVAFDLGPGGVVARGTF